MTATANPFQVHPYLQGVLRAADDESWLRVRLNGVDLFLPTGTVLTMAHCLQVVEDFGLVIYAETAHLDWMRSHLQNGAVFLDVGASTGAMTLPIAIAYPGVEMIAFEPASRARRLLKASLVKNDLYGVKVVAAAISNRDGITSFADRGVSADGSIPFLPETSTIIRSGGSDPYGEVVDVDTLTLNTIAKRYGLLGRLIVMKIDIEGFEIEALQAADDLLDNNTVFLAIDIHHIPGGGPGEMTENKCREILEARGYLQQEMLGHVLLAYK